MSIAIAQPSERELSHYFADGTIGRPLEHLSEKLGRDEKIFWEVVRISKGDIQTREKLKIDDVSLDTVDFAERLLRSIWLHSMNGKKKVGRDIQVAKIFLDILER